MNKKKSISSLKSIDLKSPKTILAMNIAVATASFLMPDDANSGYGPGSCKVGSQGDCDELTSQSYWVCTVGSFWNDCQ